MNTHRHPIEEHVLSLIRPTPIQIGLLNRLYYWIHSILDKCLKTRGLKATIKLVGSAAKGTLLRDKTEIDVFVLFHGVDDDWINTHSENLLRSCLEPHVPVIVKYSQHPYVTVVIDGLEADVVPAVFVEKPRRRGLGVERTPFHTDYVLSKLTEDMKDEVRLLKSFLKGIGVYGAEAHIAGFSGYLAELLVITYGSFRNVLAEASSWIPPVYIDPESIGDPGFLRKKYPDSPIIVVDPVDPERNAAAAVSTRSLATLITASRLYLNNPSIRFFHIASPSYGPAVESKILTVTFRGPYASMAPDIVASKAKRATRLLSAELRRHGFPVSYSSWWTDEVSTIEINIIMETGELPPYETVQGPEAWADPQRTWKFLEKRWQRREPVWIDENGRLSALRKRKYTRADALAREWAGKTGVRILEAQSYTVYMGACPDVEGKCRFSPGWLNKNGDL